MLAISIGHHRSNINTIKTKISGATRTCPLCPCNTERLANSIWTLNSPPYSTTSCTWRKNRENVGVGETLHGPSTGSIAFYFQTYVPPMRGSLILANKDICATNMALDRNVNTNAMTTTLKYQIRWCQTRGGTSPNNEGSGGPWLE